MVEITTATTASAAELIAATSYLWGQTSTGPIVERRYAVADFLTIDTSGNLARTSGTANGFGLQFTNSNDTGYFTLHQNGATGSSITDWAHSTVLEAVPQSTGNLVFSAYSGSIIFQVNGRASSVKIDSSGNLTVKSSTGGVGYSTGAGGAVTQTTSRTTGVTINKPCGAITLVSAAGGTAWQSFTVTNSLVAATDTIIVNQKSGTDKYMIHVTAVAAGSFVITFATTGGTTTEQPVFNFAIVRGVTS